MSHLQLLFDSAVKDDAGGLEMPVYSWPVIAGGCIIAAALLRWFHTFPYQPSEEEQLRDALEHQPMHSVSQ